MTEPDIQIQKEMVVCYPSDDTLSASSPSRDTNISNLYIKRHGQGAGSIFRSFRGTLWFVEAFIPNTTGMLFMLFCNCVPLDSSWMDMTATG